MRLIDRLLQGWRFRMAFPWVSAGSRVLDIGCHHGEFLESIQGRIERGVGFDPITESRVAAGLEIIERRFTSPSEFPDASFDTIVMLATLEHIHDKDRFPDECWRLLRDGGRVVITLPSPYVDYILALLCAVRLVDGMALEEHHGYSPLSCCEPFARSGFQLECMRKFQFGCNSFFVFRKAFSRSIF